MIWFSFNNCTRAIELFGEDEANHLVGKSHLRERDFLVGTVVNRLRKAVRAADDENEVLPCDLLALKPLRKLDAGEFYAPLVE